MNYVLTLELWTVTISVIIIMDYEFWIKIVIINYISSNQPFQFTPILSNSANIGKNLKVVKGASDEWTKWTSGQDACEKG